jgi:hypothetical protein
MLLEFPAVAVVRVPRPLPCKMRLLGAIDRFMRLQMRLPVQERAGSGAVLARRGIHRYKANRKKKGVQSKQEHRHFTSSTLNITLGAHQNRNRCILPLMWPDGNTRHRF